MGIGSEGLAGPPQNGGQRIAGVATLLKYGLRCVGRVEVVGCIDGQLLFGSSIGFGKGVRLSSAHVIC